MKFRLSFLPTFSSCQPWWNHSLEQLCLELPSNHPAVSEGKERCCHGARHDRADSHFGGCAVFPPNLSLFFLHWRTVFDQFSSSIICFRKITFLWVDLQLWKAEQSFVRWFNLKKRGLAFSNFFLYSSSFIFFHLHLHSSFFLLLSCFSFSSLFHTNWPYVYSANVLIFWVRDASTHHEQCRR